MTFIIEFKNRAKFTAMLYRIRGNDLQNLNERGGRSIILQERERGFTPKE